MKTASKVLSYGKLPDTQEDYQRIWVQMENGCAFILSEDACTNHPTYIFTQLTNKHDMEIWASWDQDFGSVHTKVREPRMLQVKLQGSREAHLAFQKEIWGE